jgi:ATP-dependent Clp protease ATP-binding subunit ClpC
MFERFSASAREVVTIAQELALGHDHVRSEHLLLAILSLPPSFSTLPSFLAYREITPSAVRDATFENHVPPGAANDPTFSPHAKKVLELALRESLQLGHEEITPEHVVLGILRDDSCVAAGHLRRLHVDVLKLRVDIITRLTSSKGATDTVLAGHGGSFGIEEAVSFESYGVDLTALARAGELDPVLARDTQITRVIQVLARRTKNNPILLGEPGVGKTAIVEGLAAKIAQGTVPRTLRGKTLFSLDLAALVAGTRYRGDFEDRLKRVLHSIAKHGSVILFIDEIHNLIGAGSAEGAIDAANILKPLLARGLLQTIGATTPREYQKYFEQDAALTRRFQAVPVDPPSPAETLLILTGLRPRYEAYHHVFYSDEALLAACTLSDRYLTERFLPDKAIDILDEAGSRHAVNQPSDEPPLGELLEELLSLGPTEARSQADATRASQLRTLISASPANVISAGDVSEVVAQWTGIPVATLTRSDATRLRELESELSARVVGQKEAVHAVARCVRRARAGLKSPRRPAGSFIFIGPSGVGKTELAKALAGVLLGSPEKLLTLDMSEYQEPHTVSRLVGSPPGYVGYQEAGQLTDALRRTPYSVVLFDEVEKAHPDVFNLLLQVLEEGRLTDAQGHVVDFANATIIMTSNLGTSALTRTQLGFTTPASHRSDVAIKSLREHFRPEFLNRIDEVVLFNQLGQKDIRAITELLARELVSTALATGITLEITESAYDFLAQEGFDKTHGARPLRHAITRYLTDPLSDLLLSSDATSTLRRVVVRKDALGPALTLEVRADPLPVE